MSSRLYYHEQGAPDAPALLLLHSGAMTHAEWQPQFDAFAGHFRVIAPDQPGHGRSPMTGDRLTIGDIGRAVLALLDRLGIEQASLLGSSMGGAAALWLTVHHPQRVERLVLFRASYRKNADTYAGTRQMADPAYWRAFGLERWLSRQHEPQGGADAWQTVIRRVMEAHDPDTTDHDHTLETLAGVTQPTLLICGDRDPVVPLDQVLELYRTLPNAGLWLLPYTTHVTATNTWRSDSFSQEVLRFLRGRGVVKS